MKKKTLYILTVICCMSLLSSAKQQSGKPCPSICKTTCAKKQIRPQVEEKSEYDLSHLSLFLFNL
jgi:hypothetical protein